jgi:phage gp36-like protein
MSLTLLLTQVEFEERVGIDELLQICGTGGRDTRAVDSAKCEKEIISASQLVKGYVNARFPLCITYPPEVLKGFTADIARWRLRGKGGQQAAMADIVQKRYDEAILHLKRIERGEFALEADVPAPDVNDPNSIIVNNPPVLSGPELGRVLSPKITPRFEKALEGY